MSVERTGAFDAAPLTDDALEESIEFMKSANPFCQHTWGWDTGRFIDFRWGGNVLRDAAEPGFFERHGAVVRRGDDVVALVLAEVGADDHCILTARRDTTTLDWALQELLERRHGERLVLYPSDEAAWVHEVIRRHGFVRGEVAGLEWGYDLGDVPEPFEPESFVVDSIRGPEDYASIDRCLEGAFGGNMDRIPILTSLATNPMVQRELSVVARATDGDIAAYCKGEVDPDTGVAGIDPVATRPDYQRRGLGRAVVLRCFAEQRRLGGTMSFIGSGPEDSAGSRLYQLLNPESTTSHSEWSRSP
ncbi:MAG: GNAT family N-acetyltransferase [Acidimicrobiia bacterium]|nr:GNAT family N-acetyltransferase [Acidimicrobiia bacterium]